jgi:hypothetical protein
MLEARRAAVSESSDAIVISIDAMGGDFGPPVVAEAAGVALKRLAGRRVRFLLHGDEAPIRAEMDKLPVACAACEIRHTGAVVAMTDGQSRAAKAGAKIRQAGCRKQPSRRLAARSGLDQRAHRVVDAPMNGKSIGGRDGDEVVTAHLSSGELASLDLWIAAQPEPVSRGEAVRRLVLAALKVTPAEAGATAAARKQKGDPKRTSLLKGGRRLTK